MLNTPSDSAKKAFLIATYSGAAQKIICEEHLDELALLAKTFGLQVVRKEPCSMRTINVSTYLNKGKLIELGQAVHEADIDLIIIDDEISPAQQRNLEKIFGKEIMDRTELILGVFAQRAQTKEACLQIELAQAKYQLPRLKRLWTHLSRETAVGGGAGAYLRGMGEKQIEVDKRLLRKRIDRLEKQIDQVQDKRAVQRLKRLRTGIPSFAIVGYTNTGKSTLLNALTHAEVLVEDKLFATLDTTTRKYSLSNNQEVLLIDTVGFIRKLPHLLIASFRSTLEEALQADILLHVIDVSHPNAEEQAEASYEVLKELNVDKKPVIMVLNKIDRCAGNHMVTRMRFKYPKTVLISAETGEGFEEFQNRLISAVKDRRKIVRLKIPQEKYRLVGEVMQEGTVKSKTYEDNDVIIEAEIPIALASRLSLYEVKENG